MIKVFIRDDFNEISEDIREFITNIYGSNFNRINYVTDIDKEYYIGFIGSNNKFYKLKDSAKKEEFDKLYNFIEMYNYYINNYIDIEPLSINNIIIMLAELLISTAKRNPFILKNIKIREYCRNIFFSLHNL